MECNGTGASIEEVLLFDEAKPDQGRGPMDLGRLEFEEVHDKEDVDREGLQAVGQGVGEGAFNHPMELQSAVSGGIEPRCAPGTLCHYCGQPGQAQPAPSEIYRNSAAAQLLWTERLGQQGRRAQGR